MDGDRFDSMARAWSATGSRRRAAKALLGAALGGLLSVRATGDAGAFCQGTYRRCGLGLRCCEGLACRNGICLREEGDRDRAGCSNSADCPHDGNACTANVCDERGRCVLVDVASGTRCGDNGICSTGRCYRCDERFGGTRPKICPADTPGGFNCVDLKDNDDHCGECGRACGRGSECIDGRCCRNERSCQNLAGTRTVCCDRPCLDGYCCPRDRVCADGRTGRQVCCARQRCRQGVCGGPVSPPLPPPPPIG